MAKESAAFSFFDFFANAVEEEPLPAEHSVIELFNFREQPLMAVACLCALAYVVILFSLLCYRMYIRNSRDTSKPWLGNFIDVCLEIPALLEIGPYSKENDIFDALESAMKETNLTGMLPSLSCCCFYEVDGYTNMTTFPRSLCSYTHHLPSLSLSLPMIMILYSLTL